MVVSCSHSRGRWTLLTVSENVAFIRAPRILEHSEVGVVAKFQDEVVAVRHGNLMAASFHPELTGATHLHKLFISSFN